MIFISASTTQMYSIISPIFFLCLVFSLTDSIVSDCDSCYIHQYLRQSNQKFEQRTTIFWEFNQQSNTWVEVKLPHHLVSNNDQEKNKSPEKKKDKEDDHGFLPVRKRISLTKMSETSIWVTGQSGSIYERFWNGLQWVIAPHELPVSAGFAVSIFMINQTILALSETGQLYQMQLTEESQPIWAEFDIDKGISKETIQISSGVLSNDRERLYFCTKKGQLLELLTTDPPRWANHGRPPGANVASITDAAAIRPGLLFTVSGAGDLYEYDKTAKPPWKKHIHQQGSVKENSLASISACSLHGLVGPHSVSLFLLTKGGELIERRLNQRKWKWVVHGNPRGHALTSITCVSHDEPNENSNSYSLFLTTAAGFVFEYPVQKNVQKNPDISQNQEDEEKWMNHKHPPHAKVARGISGLQLQFGRMIFALDDGRLAELHLSGLGGESLGPNAPLSTRRKSSLKYVWSLLDAPESEGWNAEYCTEERGPSNCILGTKDEVPISRWRKDTKTHQNYLLPSLSSVEEDHVIPIKKSFRLRLMQERKSFFLISDDGLALEYMDAEDVWLWLKHEHSTRIEGAIGSYNGSLFVVDEQGSVLIRERNEKGLAWMNCSALRRGRQVAAGAPWDNGPRGKPDDAVFFVSKSGRLLQLTVGMRKLKWKDCKNPGGMKIASIVDQEGLRGNIVMVIGRNGRMYQYNKVTELWHEHYQSQHLVLSRSTGTAMRGLGKGSVFMVSEDGGLVEYEWSSIEGWNWIEHGAPLNVRLVDGTGPGFGGVELFLIGLDGNVYLRYFDGNGREWKWRDCGFPWDGDFADHGNCDSKVSSTRPIPFAEDSVVFELRDGRLAEMRRVEGGKWIWSRTIATPTTLCMLNFWTSS